MAVYVEDARHPFGRMIMCHMVADSLEELFQASEAIGMRRAWFQKRSFPHFDLSVSRRRAAVLNGAFEVDRREIVAVMRRYGLRLQPDDAERAAFERETR